MFQAGMRVQSCPIQSVTTGKSKSWLHQSWASVMTENDNFLLGTLCRLYESAFWSGMHRPEWFESRLQLHGCGWKLAEADTACHAS